MRKHRLLSLLASLAVVALTGVEPMPARAQPTLVETVSGTMTTNVVLPGLPDGQGGIDFDVEVIPTSLDFTPGSVTFAGSPVDFDGTEADFLASTYVGTTNFPAASGPAVVPSSGLGNLFGPTTASATMATAPIELGPSFSDSFLDVLTGQTVSSTAGTFNWNSSVVPELNGLFVESRLSVQVLAVDPIQGIVDSQFTGEILAEAPIGVPTLSTWGLALIGAGVLVLGFSLLRRGSATPA